VRRLHWRLPSRFFALKSPRRAGAALALAVAYIALAAWHFVPPRTPDAAAAGERLSILHFNVAFRHEDPRRVVDYLLSRADRFDVVVLIEASEAWTRELKRLADAYPYSARTLEDSPWGIAVFSKAKPLASAVVESPDGTRHSELRLAVAGRSRPVTIYGIHPPPPIGRVLAEARNARLEDFARRIRGRPDETAIVVGDFNLTPYSPYFRAFAESSGLRPVRGGTLPRSTWPSILAGFGLGIPIDHTFAAADTAVVTHEIGPDLGSDHLPVEVTFALR
jgi:endonuclease/exonuclease/phosphatase (EEP) superfamily protein YafD